MDDTEKKLEEYIEGLGIDRFKIDLAPRFGEREQLDISPIKDRLESCIAESEDQAVLNAALNVVVIASNLKERYGESAEHPLPHCDWCGSWTHFSPTAQVVHEDDCEWLALQKAIEALQESMKPT